MEENAWKQAQYLADIFWKRWILWYLPTLQVKQKWLRPRPNLAVGDLVLVVGFGPMLVKSRRSQVKRYGFVFTCLAIRAVHIEIAHDLTADSFIQAFTRFVSRRGSPIEVFSDNGTNFKGADSEIKTALEHWNPDRIDNCLRRCGIRWNFNHLHASHAGGVWERMSHSIRKILRSLLGTQIVNDETLLTLMAEVEKILNDRPLIPPPSPRQVIRAILSLSLQVNYSSCGQTHVSLFFVVLSRCHVHHGI